MQPNRPGPGRPRTVVQQPNRFVFDSKQSTTPAPTSTRLHTLHTRTNGKIEEPCSNEQCYNDAVKNEKLCVEHINVSTMETIVRRCNYSSAGKHTRYMRCVNMIHAESGNRSGLCTEHMNTIARKKRRSATQHTSRRLYSGQLQHYGRGNEQSTVDQKPLPSPAPKSPSTAVSSPLVGRGGFGEHTAYSDMSDDDDLDDAHLANMWQRDPSVALRVKLDTQHAQIMTKSEILHGHAERLVRLQQLYGDTEAMLRREYLISRAKYRRDLRRLLGNVTLTSELLQVLAEYAPWMNTSSSDAPSGKSRSKKLNVDMPASHDHTSNLHAHHKRMRRLWALAKKDRVKGADRQLLNQKLEKGTIISTEGTAVAAQICEYSREVVVDEDYAEDNVANVKTEETTVTEAKMDTVVKVERMEVVETMDTTGTPDSVKMEEARTKTITHKCKGTVLPYTKYCTKHIGMDRSQLLFRQCGDYQSITQSNDKCRQSVLPIWKHNIGTNDGLSWL